MGQTHKMGHLGSMNSVGPTSYYYVKMQLHFIVKRLQMPKSGKTMHGRIINLLWRLKVVVCISVEILHQESQFGSFGCILIRRNTSCTGILSILSWFQQRQSRHITLISEQQPFIRIILKVYWSETLVSLSRNDTWPDQKLPQIILPTSTELWLYSTVDQPHKLHNFHSSKIIRRGYKTLSESLSYQPVTILFLKTLRIR